MKIMIIVVLIAYWYFQLAFIKIKKINIITKSFSGEIKFAQISDFHDNKFINLRSLEKSLKKFNPDIVFLTGDILSRNTRDIKHLEEFLKILSDYKTLFVSGNHEVDNKIINVKDILNKYNIVNLDNAFYDIIINEKCIRIFGEEFGRYNNFDEWKEYNVLIVHNPNQFVNNVKPYNLVLSGHKHGGQVRLPLLGQIIDHGMVFFPKYSMGMYKINDTNFYIDSGLGQSVYLRIHDRVSYTQGIIKGDGKN